MKRVLIANRGEIALRILRACKVRGIESVVVYTKADRDLGYLHLADRQVCIGTNSYLESDQLLAAALAWQCDAIHPGYGFLSESADFAAQAESSGLIFIGPASVSIREMADKSAARLSMADAGMSVLQGSRELMDEEQAVAAAAQLGYPLMLKACHGGGGRGMAVVEDESRLRSQFETMQQEAAAFFGHGSLYLERYLAAPRHIEIQVAGDGQGTVLHLGARECSIQRRHQKVLEEAPPPDLAGEQIEQLGALCCRVLGSLGYRSLGTLEFLWQDDCFFFMEMNTRIQVEHPVTEAVTGIDLVGLQLEIAETSRLPFSQADIRCSGHAIECRINAEDREFRPAPGVVDRLRIPGGPGIRFDTHLYEGYRVAHHYDAMVGKLVASGNCREEAVARMRAALEELDLGGLVTNLSLHRDIMEDQRFIEGNYHTGFLEAF